MTVYRSVPANESLRAHELFDDDLLRYQLKNWRWRDPVLSATGEAIDDTLKLDDDFGQSLQMFYMKQLITNTPLTPEEQVEAEMPPELSQQNLAQSYGQPGYPELIMRRQAERRRVELQMEEERERDEQKLRDIFSSGRRVRLLGNLRR
jgi:hypothetical protein